MSDSVLLEKMENLFANNGVRNSMRVNGKCHICGEKTVIDIFKTSQGYGINGGIFQKTDQDQWNPVCIGCYCNSKPYPELKDIK